MKQWAEQAFLWIARPLTLLILGLLFCLFSLFAVFSQYKEHMELKHLIRSLYIKELLIQKETAKHQSLIERLKSVDPDYVQNNLENRVFLEGEIRNLEAMMLTGKRQLEDVKRLEYLKEGGNRLSLLEERFQRIGNWQEVEIAQERPVEMSRSDLMQFLATLEHTQIDVYTPDARAPDFLVDDFEMIRKLHPNQEETYFVKIHCIKKEYIRE